jgi:mono/diheme cytochrome c family protein
MNRPGNKRGSPLLTLGCLPVLVMTWQASIAAGPAARDESPGKIWDGVYTSAQADRGKTRFTAICRRCHNDDLGGSERGPALRGEQFMKNWETQELSRLFAKARDTMPPDSPSSLPDEDYVDVVAYILQANSFPAGKESLNSENLDSIVITKRTGEGPLEIPNFRLVRIVGCLAQGPDKTWMLTSVGEPALTTDQPSTPAALQDAAAEPPGPHRFRLVSSNPFDPDAHKGEKMEAKGLIYRAPGKDLINVISLERVAGGGCGS